MKSVMPAKDTDPKFLIKNGQMYTKVGNMYIKLELLK